MKSLNNNKNNKLKMKINNCNNNKTLMKKNLQYNFMKKKIQIIQNRLQVLKMSNSNNKQ